MPISKEKKQVQHLTLEQWKLLLRTVFELGSLHIPMIAIPVNNREKKHTFVKKYDVGHIIPLDSSLDSKKFLSSFKIMSKSSERKKFQDNLRKINLLNGVDRVVSKIINSYEGHNKS